MGTNDPVKGKMRRFRTILEEDYNFDAIKELVDLYYKVCRSRIKKAQKYKMQFDMLTAIIAYSYPKLKTEETKHQTGDKIFFNIQVGADPQPSALPGNNPNNTIQIPTHQANDGSFVIDVDAANAANKKQ